MTTTAATVTNNDRIVGALAHLAHHLSRRAVQEQREGNSIGAKRYREDAHFYLRWSRQRADTEGCEA